MALLNSSSSSHLCFRAQRCFWVSGAELSTVRFDGTSQGSGHVCSLPRTESGLRGKAVCTFGVTCWKEHWIQDQEAWMLAPCQPLTSGEIIRTIIATFIQYLL